MTNVGSFNKRITFQRKSKDYDADGYPVDIVENIMTVWAAVKPVSAKEFLQAKADQVENITRFVIRYRKNLIKDDMTIRYGNRNFEIVTIINDYEDNTTLTIIGREVL